MTFASVCDYIHDSSHEKDALSTFAFILILLCVSFVFIFCLIELRFENIFKKKINAKKWF